MGKKENRPNAWYQGFQEHLPENVRLEGMTDWLIVPSAVKTAA
jgi:hypothetical protein